MKKLLLLAGAGCLALAAGLLLVAAFLPRGAGRLTWQRPIVKKSVHTFAYKVYANPKLRDGRFFLSKLVLKNEGEQPVRDFSVSYEIPGYVNRTNPEVLPALPAGHTHVALFYPQLPESVTKLRNLTTGTLEIHLQWRDRPGGPAREETLRENFNLRGVNEIEYTDLPAEEILTVYDGFANDELLAAMVTPNDPVVTQYAAAVTERLGGAVAGAGGPKEVIEVMRGTYEYMCATGLRYAGAQGVPENLGDVSSLVQTIRLPRDVILNNNGLCVELALLWASVLEHLGIHGYVELIPGHAFVIAESQGQIFPLECTAITPKSVGKNQPVGFEEAMRMAAGELENVLKEGKFHQELDVQALQGAGIRPPELPDIDADRIRSILAGRERAAARPGGAERPPLLVDANARPSSPADEASRPAPPDNDNNNDNSNNHQNEGTGSIPAGFQSYTLPDGRLRFAFPGDWLHGPPGNRAVPQLIFAAYDQARTTIGLEAYYCPGQATPEAAMRSIVASWRQVGVRVEPQAPESGQGAVFFNGRSYNRNNQYVWRGVFRPDERGGCAAVIMGVSAPALETQKSNLNQLGNYITWR